MDKTAVQSVIEAAGPGGRVTIRYRDYFVPKLDENHEAVKDEAGNAIYGQDEIGHVRTVCAPAHKLIDGHVVLGSPGALTHLIALDDIERMTPDYDVE